MTRFFCIIWQNVKWQLWNEKKRDPGGHIARFCTVSLYEKTGNFARKEPINSGDFVFTFAINYYFLKLILTIYFNLLCYFQPFFVNVKWRLCDKKKHLLKRSASANFTECSLNDQKNLWKYKFINLIQKFC